jgi:hypothetical protein
MHQLCSESDLERNGENDRVKVSQDMLCRKETARICSSEAKEVKCLGSNSWLKKLTRNKRITFNI